MKPTNRISVPRVPWHDNPPPPEGVPEDQWADALQVARRQGGWEWETRRDAYTREGREVHVQLAHHAKCLLRR